MISSTINDLRNLSGESQIRIIKFNQDKSQQEIIIIRQISNPPHITTLRITYLLKYSEKRVIDLIQII